jgi:tetratricopeptide (TPR) repeat protein
MRYLFKHILMRDTAYEMQLREHLREMHKRAAEAIETLHRGHLAPYYADLAYHYRQAEIPEKERHYAALAGKEAAMEYANDEALRLLGRALDLTPDDDLAARTDLLMVRERVYDLQGKRDAQRRDLQVLLYIAKGEQKAEVVHRQARYSELVGNYTSAADAAQRAVILAQQYGDPQLETDANLVWGRAIWRQGRYNEAIPYFERAMTLAQESAFPIAEADSLRNLGNVAWCLGQHEKAMRYYQEALPKYRALDHKRGESATLNNISIVLMDWGNYDQAQQYSERALTLKQEIGDHIGVSIAHNTLGNIAYYLGRYAKANDYYQRALRLSKEAGDSPGQSEYLNNMARLAHQQGRDEEAYEYSQKSLALAQHLGDVHLEAYAHLYLGHAATGREVYDEAETAYERTLELRRQLTQPHLATEPLAGLAALHMKQQNLPAARACIRPILKQLALRIDPTGKPRGNPQALDGTREPFRVYLVCHNVLRATGDPLTDALLDFAEALLQKRAAQLTDPEARRSFLENVPTHHTLIQRARQSE